MLKKKQSITNNDWLQTVRIIRDLVPKAEIDRAMANAVKAIQKATAGKRVAYAWSGGKGMINLICH